MRVYDSAGNVIEARVASACSSQCEIVAQLRFELKPQRPPAFVRLSAIRLTRQTIRLFALNGEFGNTRDASVHGEGTKSRWPKRVGHALQRRN
jgi:hypothetical protein